MVYFICAAILDQTTFIHHVTRPSTTKQYLSTSSLVLGRIFSPSRDGSSTQYRLLKTAAWIGQMLKVR